MDIVGIPENIATTQQNNTTLSKGALAKQDFLSLLTTQLRYQDPTAPMDNSQMSAQLAQFSQLEALENIDSTMQDQLLLSQSMNNSFMTSMIGKGVKAYGNAIKLEDGESDIHYYIGGTGKATVSIYNEEGILVREIEGNQVGYGDHVIQWDGKDSDGNPVGEGDYTFSVEGLDSAGKAISCETYSVGHIEGIAYEEGSPFLYVNGSYINLSEIIELLEN